MRHGKYLKLICAVLAFLMLTAATCTPALAKESINSRAVDTLRVAFFPLTGFFEYDQNGNEIGYGVDLLNLISKYTGYQFEYVPADSWEDTKGMLMDGEADIRMPGTPPLSKSSDLIYSDYSIIDSYYAIMTKNDRDDLYYQDYETFRELKIAVSQNLYNTAEIKDELAEANIEESNIVFYDGYNEGRAALENGDVDAILSNIMDLDDGMKQLARLDTVHNYISMRIDDPRITEINDALSDVNQNEASLLSGLYKKWFPERVSVPFTKEETEYIENLDSITFSFRDGQGYLSRITGGDKFVGFYPSMAELLCEKLGVTCKQTILQGEAAGETVVYPDYYYDYSWADENNVNITQPYVNVNYYAITNSGGNVDSDTCKIAAVDGFRVTTDFIGTDYDSTRIVWCKDYLSCIDAVLNGSADITYINSTTAEYYLDMYRYRSLNFALTDISHHACCGVYGDDTGMLVSVLNKILMSIPESELDTILIQSTSDHPESDIFAEWLYRNPFQSMLIIGVVGCAVAALLMGIMYLRRMRKKNLELLEATNAKQRFLSRISHDMRTPMNAIIGLSSFGEDSGDTEELKTYLKKINHAGQYLLQLINDSLDLSKMISGKYEIYPEEYLNTDFIASVKNIILPQTSEKKINFSIKCDAPEPTAVMIDKTRIQQIFINLLNNAVKFTPQGGSVSLEITHEEQGNGGCMLHFTVSDNGIGMSEKYIAEKLYKPFEQEHSENSEAGTGLGLSIVKELVDAMGGTISCKSKLGAGTVFYVDIPTKIVRGGFKPELSAVPTEIKGKRVLVCEDQPVNREIVVRMLKKHGIITETAENGKIGVEKLMNSQPGYYSAVLMDIRMPVMDGIAAVREIRKAGRKDLTELPIIALSANAYDEDKKMCIEAGMNEHMSKPIDPTVLIETLQKFIR